MEARTTIRCMVVAVAVLVLASAARADWDPGDGHKMHYPQLPDPQGWDVYFGEPYVLADDWLCTQTGPVEDIHFWFSSWQDMPFQILNIHASIHANDLTNPEFSQPGELLWDRNFEPVLFTVRDYGTGSQGWFDPSMEEAYPEDHFMFYQANIVDISDPFIQDEGMIYWLDLSVTADPMAELGWKTSQDHFEDDAVWLDPMIVSNGGDPPNGSGGLIGWQELRDPFTTESLDLAFVITPEPATLALMGLGLAGLLARRRRR